MTVHYRTPPVRGASFAKIACQQNLINRGGAQHRMAADNITEVTCKRCLASAAARKVLAALEAVSESVS